MACTCNMDLKGQLQVTCFSREYSWIHWENPQIHDSFLLPHLDATSTSISVGICKRILAPLNDLGTRILRRWVLASINFNFISATFIFDMEIASGVYWLKFRFERRCLILHHRSHEPILSDTAWTKDDGRRGEEVRFAPAAAEIFHTRLVHFEAVPPSSIHPQHFNRILPKAATVQLLPVE